ncbi:MAG TPA: hypothetical protein VKP30_30080 [Polyangiaceae bacterium]|nr:hypothetical protein [Polyangiaceae bacterium]
MRSFLLDDAKRLSIVAMLVHYPDMILSQLFERYIDRAPISVMARTLMEAALVPEELNALFEQTADRQYTRTLLFSSMVDLMGVVVSKSRFGTRGLRGRQGVAWRVAARRLRKA